MPAWLLRKGFELGPASATYELQSVCSGKPKDPRYKDASRAHNIVLIWNPMSALIITLLSITLTAVRMCWTSVQYKEYPNTGSLETMSGPPPQSLHQDWQ